MTIFSFHLVETTPATTLRALFRPPAKVDIAGLHHAECMAAMTLGAPILSPARMKLRNLAVFAAWENGEALDRFLAHHKFTTLRFRAISEHGKWLGRSGIVPQY